VIMYTGSFDPRVAAYTAAACSCEKHSVMLTEYSLHRHFCGSQALVGARIFHIGIGNPCEISWPLGEHVLSTAT